MPLIPILLTLLAGAPAPSPGTILVMHATVVSMDGAPPRPGHSVLVEDGRIAWVGPDSAAAPAAADRVVNAAGGYLLPGLADMHVHATADDFGAFLANGVTTIREMNGTPDHLAWRDDVAAGRLLGPTLVVTGPLIAGEEQRWRHVLAKTPEEAAALVREHAAAGYDAVKVYSGLTAESYDALAATGRETGIPFVGHVPQAVGLERTLAAGQVGIEHAVEILHAEFHEVPDSAALRAVADRIAAAETWVTPTLASHEALALVASPEYARRLELPEIAWVDEGLVGWWRSLLREPDSARTAERLRRFAIQGALVRALNEAGVGLLAGTDTPNPLMVPGTSIHDELRNLVAAGLTPYEAIETATAAPARFLGKAGDFGTIAPGARADLVLVEGDPLQDVGALARPVGVMVRGVWLQRERLVDLTAAP